MQSTLNTIRAVGAEFANRLWLPIVIVVAIVAVILIGLIWWLSAAVSTWWLLLGIPVIIILSVAAVVLTIVKLVVRYVSPVTTERQKNATNQFVDKLSNVAEAVGTPKFVLLFYVVRDIAAPREQGFIGEFISNTGSLKGDFKKLRKLF